jgi:hypothetical protein
VSLRLLYLIFLRLVCSANAAARRSTPPSPNTATACASRTAAGPTVPTGQHHPLHLTGNALGKTGRLRGHRRHTVGDQIENQLAQHKRITH